MTDLHGDRAVGDDPAVDAARVIGDEALSILLAVEATAAEIDADARRRADDIRRSAHAATAPALAQLQAMARDLEALAGELDIRAAERSDGRHGS